MLTEKQKIFIKEYLIDLNASAAAVRAGYSAKNSDKIGSQLLGKTRVSEQIRIETEARTKKLEIKADAVLQELAKIAFVNIGDFIEMNESNEIKFKPLKSLKPSETAAIKSISSGANGMNIQFYDKLTALKSLGDYLNLWSGEIRENEEGKAERERASTQRMVDIINKRIEREAQKKLEADASNT